MADTYNPIISQDAIEGWRLFYKRPVTNAKTALVFAGEGKPLLTIKQGERGITHGEMLWGKYHVLYRVDMAEHSLKFKCSLPCKGDAFNFHSELTFICSVRDPATIVQRNVTDVRQVLEPLIVEVMRSKSREYDRKDSGIAERDISNSVKKVIYDEGFQAERFVLQLSLDKEVSDHIRKETSIDDETKIQTKIIQGEIVIEQQQQELDKLRQNHEFELMKLKMDFYSPIIQAGNWQILAMQLAQNPQDIQIIVQQLNEQKQLEQQHQMKMLRMLIDEDALEGSQINEIGKAALQKLLGIAEQSIPELTSSNQKTDAHDAVLDVNSKDDDYSNIKTPEFNDWDEDD